MSPPDSIPVLNRLQAILSRSLPQYMAYARPFLGVGSEEAVEILGQMAADQTAMSERVCDLIEQSERRIDCGRFPIVFTGWHDLGIDFIVDRTMEGQRNEIAEIDTFIDDLRLAPAARSLAEESLGMAKGHLESLEELVATNRVAT